MTGETNWLPGLVVLAVGLLAGLLFVLLSRRNGAAAPAPEDARLADLEQHYRTLIAQLKALAADQHLLGDRYEAEKARLERAAADALRARDAHLRGAKHEQEKASARAARAKQAQGFFGKNPALKGALFGAGAVLFVVLVFALVAREATPRDEPPPRAAQEQEDPHFQALLDRLGRNPSDIESITEVAHELIRRQQFEDALQLTNRALGIDPHHVETRIHRAVLVAAEGDDARALAQLEHLANTYPDAHEALLFAGALAHQLGDKKKALELFERFAAEAPPSEQPPALERSIERLKAELAAPN